MAIELIQQPTAQQDGNRKMSRPSDALLCDMDLPLRRTFYPLGFAVEIATNHPDVLEAASNSFGHRRLRHGSATLEVRIGISKGGGPECPPEPTRREYNHLYSLVADAENQALLDLKTHTSFVWLNTSALKNRLYFRYNFLEKVVYLLLGSSVVTDIHGACVSKNGRGILLCGDSGAGKSTLAYAGARAGWTYVSDDTSYLINDSDIPRVIGHSNRMRFRPAAKALFPELAHCKLTPRMEGKASIEVPVSELRQIVTTTEANVHAVVYLNRHPSASGRLVRLPEGTATERTRKELYSAGEIRAKHEKILEMLSRIPTFALRYSEFDQAVQQLERLAWDARTTHTVLPML
jgi:energy-coupling factor transporter ATP-binding protein EcfA2